MVWSPIRRRSACSRCAKPASRRAFLARFKRSSGASPSGPRPMRTSTSPVARVRPQAASAAPPIHAKRIPAPTSASLPASRTASKGSAGNAVFAHKFDDPDRGLVPFLQRQALGAAKPLSRKSPLLRRITGGGKGQADSQQIKIVPEVVGLGRIGDRLPFRLHDADDNPGER